MIPDMDLSWLTPHRRALRRVARSAARALMTPELRDRLAELVDDVLRDLPPTTFRCAACGKRVDGASEGNHFKCPDHGKLEAVTLTGLREEWTRRGCPEHLTLKLKPLCLDP